MTDRVAALHFTPTFGALTENREALGKGCAEAAGQAQVVVLPELATTGFCLSREQAEAWAEHVDGPTIRSLAKIARENEAVIVVGLALREEDGVLRNAQVVIDADGSVAAIYAKRHLYGEDANWATAGDELGGLAHTAAGDLGLLICHDIVYPPTVLAVVRQRPRLLALSTAWIGDGIPLPMSWALAIRLLDPTPLVVANRGGVEAGIRFEDPSLVLSHTHGGCVGPRGDGPHLVYGDLR